MYILGINISHDPSISQIIDGQICSVFQYPFEEDWTLKKVFSDEYKKRQPDFVIYTSFDKSIPAVVPDGCYDLQVIEKVQKFLDYPRFLFFPKHHHLYHAFNSFHRSNFDEAICIVLDGGGSQIIPAFQEIESIYYFTKNSYKCYFQHLTCFRSFSPIMDYMVNINGVETKISSEMSSGNKFQYFINYNMIDKNIVDSLKSGEERMLYWYEISQKMMNLYYSGDEMVVNIHNETRDKTIEFIEKSLNYQHSKNIVMSGGYILNHVNNKQYKNHFHNHNFFFDPIASDEGTSCGAGLWLNFQLTRLKKTITDLKKLPLCYTNL